MAYCSLAGRSLARSKPDGWVRLLHWFGFHSDILELPERTRHLGPGLCPQRFHDLYPFHEAAHALPAGEPKNGLRHVSANTNADGQPSLAELIQARDEFGELHG